MAMFGWLTSRAHKPRRRATQRVLAPVDEIAEQGVLVADVAVRLSVKNAIIMNALAKHEDYSSERVAELVREALANLAAERDADAKHLEAVIGEIDKFGHSGWIEADYGIDDNRTIKHRLEVYRLVADELRAQMNDTEYVTETAENARKAAWKEIGDSLKTKAEHPYYGGGNKQEYFDKREERIQNLIEKDLTRLVRESKKSESNKKSV